MSARARCFILHRFANVSRSANKLSFHCWFFLLLPEMEAPSSAVGLVYGALFPTIFRADRSHRAHQLTTPEELTSFVRITLWIELFVLSMYTYSMMVYIVLHFCFLS